MRRELKRYIIWKLKEYKGEGKRPKTEREKQTAEAIGRVLGRTEKDSVELVKLVYWERSHTVRGAADKLYMSEATAYRKIDRLIREIAEELGEIE